MRSYKRFFIKQNKLLKSEILILKILDFLSDLKGKQRTQTERIKTAEEVELLKKAGMKTSCSNTLTLRNGL
jgi:hypothetical protein